jgi:hypothetical protein
MPDDCRGASPTASKHLFVLDMEAGQTEEATRLPFGVWDHAQCPVAACPNFPHGALLIFGGRASSASTFSEHAYLLDINPQHMFQACHTLKLTCVAAAQRML